MGNPADGYHHCVYAIYNQRNMKAYIGITRQLVEKRFYQHKANTKNVTKAREIVHLKDTIFEKLTDYIYEAHEVKSVETRWAKFRKGYQILNSPKQYGQTGASGRIHSDEDIFKEAKKIYSKS